MNWPDHIVAFFSALFGILIAFQLEEWRDQSERKQLVQLALQNLHNEIDINKNYYEETTHFNDNFLSFIENSSEYITPQLEYKGTRSHGDSINTIFPNYFNIQFEDKTDVKLVVAPLRITLKIAVLHPLTAAWESAKATGAVNYMSFERVNLLSRIYHQERLLNEVDYINSLIKTSTRIETKEELMILVRDLKESNSILRREVEELKSYINILLATE